MSVIDSHNVDAARLQLAVVELTKLLPIEIPLPQIMICARDLLLQVNILPASTLDITCRSRGPRYSSGLLCQESGTSSSNHLIL